MAHLLIRPNSRYYRLGYTNREGKYVRESTGLRHDVPGDIRRAKRVEALKTLEEAEYRESKGAESWDWVHAFFNARYKMNPTTLERYLCCWQTLEMFLRGNDIRSPRQLQREHCYGYVAWRQVPNHKLGIYKASRNTALLELKVLRLVMFEAVERGLCQGNPCVKLRLVREPSKLKPAMTEEIIKLIREKIADIKDPDEREFFYLSFEIARYQGCRLKETSLNPQIDVAIHSSGKTGKICFHIKGGKEFTTLLHPNLIPIFKKLKAQGRTVTWKIPDGMSRQWASTKWFRFMRDHGIKSELLGVCFHSTRVTVATEMYRGNIPIRKAKEYVGHASTTVHEAYKRSEPDDLGECVHVIG